MQNKVIMFKSSYWLCSITQMITMNKGDLLRFHLSPVVIVWQGPPTGMRLHQSPSRPVFTPSLWLPC